MTKIKSVLFTIFGTMLTAFGIGVFLTPNKIVGGGVSGLSTILYHAFSVPPGVSFFLINIAFLAIGFTILGKEFTVKTLLGASLISVFVQVFSYIPFYTENTMLATVFGGILYGIGIGLGFVVGAYTNDAKKMLFCTLKEVESDAFQRKILEIDKTAFIVFSESQRIKGNGFYLYK